jgi:hypothetical protein
MSVVPQIFNGLKGNVAVDTIGNIPSSTNSNDGLSKPTLRLNWTRTTRVENPTCLRQSVLKTNQGGSRGVMPCKGVVSVGFAGGASRILRRPAIPYQGGMYPSQGYARSQQKGLAYLVGKPINQPLMPIADSFNAGLTSRLGQPKSLEMK